MQGTFETSMDIMIGCDTLQIVDVSPEAMEKQRCILARHLRNLQACSAYCHYVLVIRAEGVVGGGAVNLRHIRAFKGRERVVEAIWYLITCVNFSRNLELLNWLGGARLGRAEEGEN